MSEAANEAVLPDPQSFETALNALEEVISALEAGNLPLEKTVAMFNEGVKLSAYCEQALENAKQQIEQAEIQAQMPLSEEQAS